MNYRELGDGTCEMVCALNIDANLLNSTRGYKYVVYSPKMVSGDDCFEYLHSFAGKHSYDKDPNRCLKINGADLNSRCMPMLLCTYNAPLWFLQEPNIISTTSLCILN